MGRFLFLLMAAGYFLMPASAKACAVCFGSPGSADTKALSFAILALLAVLGVVLASIVAFIIYLGRHGSGLPAQELHSPDLSHAK